MQNSIVYINAATQNSHTIGVQSAARTDAPRSLSFDLPGAGDAGHPRQVNLVVIDAETGRPVQALKIGC